MVYFERLKILIAVNLAFIMLPVFLTGCGNDKENLRMLDTRPVSMRRVNIPDGADNSVSPESGGMGFSGVGWKTKTNYNIVSKPGSFKGGGIKMSVPEFPVTVCPYGKDYNNYFSKYCGSLLYETLLQTDPLTSEYVPHLATHWKISDDGKTFKYRLNPDARWADGNPVTSRDVIATWKLLVDEGILDPYTNHLFGSFEEPFAESKYIVSVKSKTAGWRQFLYFSTGMKILPAHYIENASGKDLIEKYRFSYLPGSGPYLITDNEIVKGKEITIRRRSDYWGEKERFSAGKFNFDLITLTTESSDAAKQLRFEKGEIDIAEVNKVSDWEEKYNYDIVKRGMILKRKIYNYAPRGINGICMNTLKSPLNDLRVRKALSYAFDREKINKKLFYGSYTLMNSYYPGTVYENPSNPRAGFNLDSAEMLLENAGWKKRNAEGYLVRNGTVFEIDLLFHSGMDRFLTVYQEDLKKIGIKLNLKQADPSLIMKLGQEKNFLLLPVSWIPALIPNPESNYLSELSDLKNNSNWSGINNREIDRLIKEYNNEDKQENRISTIRSIDSILTANVCYLLFWYAPYTRIVFHNVFAFPECMIEKESGIESVFSLWSFDSEKIKKYNEAMRHESVNLDTGNVDNKFWLRE